MTYPSKVEAVLAAIRAVDFNPWQNITVEKRDDAYIIRAERPGNVFVHESLQLFVWAWPARTIAGTNIRLRASQRFAGGTQYRFGSDVKIKRLRDIR